MTVGLLVMQMNAYVQSNAGTLSNGDTDVRRMVEDCLRSINVSEFPPQLFVVWTTADYVRFVPQISAELSARGFGDVPLIGGSALACFFGGDVYEHSAVLIC